MSAHWCRQKKRKGEEARWRWGERERWRERLIIITDFSSLCRSITCSLQWVSESKSVCVCVCVGLTLSTQPYSHRASPVSPSAESQEQPTQVAHLEYKHTKNLLFQLTFVTSSCQWSQLCTLRRFLLLFLQGGLHGNEHSVQNRWEQERRKWYARAFSPAVFLV